MLKKKEGKIVNISSIIASTGYNGLSVYGATKAAIIGFTKSLSRELGKVGIYVNCVSPGFMETNMTQNIDKQNLEKIMRRSPMKELAKSEEVAEVVNFLMSEGSNSITGEEIIVDKGSTA
jgi:3-oxoacyl-[acyl-carrier protein] reductase